MANFDVVKKIIELDRRVFALENAQPSANMDASSWGANLDGLPQGLRASLEAAGFTTPYALMKMSDQELRAIDGVGPASVRLIRAALG